MGLNITVLCTFGRVFLTHLTYKYSAALLHRINQKGTAPHNISG